MHGVVDCLSSRRLFLLRKLDFRIIATYELMMILGKILKMVVQYRRSTIQVSATARVRLMASVLDVAAYIMAQCGPMTATKLQKLAYYSQAWSLVWDEKPLFDDRIEAWANGPVTPRLYAAHYRQFMVEDISGNPDELDDVAKETIDAVIGVYGDKQSQWLSDLTHEEEPWLDARGDTPDGGRCTNEITHAAMAEYYGSL